MTARSLDERHAAVPTDPPGIVRVEAGRHLALVTAVLRGLGASERAAGDQAELLLEADLRGHASHGLRRLDVLVQRIRNGVARPGVEPVLEWTTDNVLQVDGRMGLGPPTARRAVEALLERVRRTGIAVAAVREANHVGMLAPYVEQLAAAGVIGIGFTTSEALVHPWGGSISMVGTNPVAIAIPNGEQPVVLDMATGQISRGKVLDHAARGIPLSPGDAVDRRGAPTTDARAALDGSISPFGGAKGYALGVVLEVLVATLTRTALGRDVRGTLDVSDHCNKGDVFIALDPVAFGGGAPDAVAAYLDDLRATPPAPGRDGVSVPGDRARATREANARNGVPVAETTWQLAVELAAGVAAERGAPDPDLRREA